jgi:hypothetical protein
VSRGEAEELAALRAIVEAVSRRSGEEYFQAFVRYLARLVGVHYADDGHLSLGIFSCKFDAPLAADGDGCHDGILLLRGAGRANAPSESQRTYIPHVENSSLMLQAPVANAFG